MNLQMPLTAGVQYWGGGINSYSHPVICAVLSKDSGHTHLLQFTIYRHHLTHSISYYFPRLLLSFKYPDVIHCQVSSLLPDHL